MGPNLFNSIVANSTLGVKYYYLHHAVSSNNGPLWQFLTNKSV